MAAMQGPFPALTHLSLCTRWPGLNESLASVPEEFLNGSAQRLQILRLDGIVFPRKWNLLLTAHHLVDLHLHDIPHSDDVSPEEMVTYLSVMPNLRHLAIGFLSALSRPHFPNPQNRPPPPLTYVFLPVLTSFSFYGVSEYAEDLLSRIDISLVNCVYMRFFDQFVFHTPRLHDFLSRAERLKVHNRATLRFRGGVVNFERNSMSLMLTIFCSEPDRQLSAMAQLCNSPLPPFSDLESLQIRDGEIGGSYWQDNMEHSRWLDLVGPFSSVKNLYLSRNIVPRVALALRELTGERVTEALPALQNLFLEGHRTSGPAHEAIMRFLTARWLSGYPVAVHSWDGRW